MEKTVRKVRRLLRSRFLRTSIVNFIALRQTILRERAAGFPSDAQLAPA